MTSNVAYERSFAELSNGHGFSMVRVITLAKIIKTICSVFFFATVSRVLSNALRDPLGRVGRSLGTGGPDTGNRGLGMGRGSTGARYRASVPGNGTKSLTIKQRKKPT